MREYKHFTYQERLEIKKLIDKDVSIGDIALKLNVHQSSVYRELKRGKNANDKYDPLLAEENNKRNLSQKGSSRILSIDNELAKRISELILTDEIGVKEIPEIIRNEGLGSVSYTTIYNAIDDGLIPNVTRESLRNKKTKMFSKGILHVPSWIREELDISDGDALSIDITDDNTIVIKKLSQQD